MPDQKISAMTAATTLADTDELVLASTGVNKKITGANLKASMGGAVTKIFDQIVTGTDAATIDTGVGSIPAGYTFLQVLISGRTDDTGGQSECLLRFNNDSAGNYRWRGIGVAGTLANLTGSGTDPGWLSGWDFYLPSASHLANYAGSVQFTIPNHDGTTFYKVGNWIDGFAEGSDVNSRSNARVGSWLSTAAITRISLATFTAGKKFKVGSRMTVYGFGG